MKLLEYRKIHKKPNQTKTNHQKTFQYRLSALLGGAYFRADLFSKKYGNTPGPRKRRP